jgi:hypothetical protein
MDGGRPARTFLGSNLSAHLREVMVDGILHLKHNDDGSVTFRFCHANDDKQTRPIFAKDIGTAKSDLMINWLFTSARADAAVEFLERHRIADFRISIISDNISSLY